MGYFKEIIDEIVKGDISSPDELQKAKMRFCKEYERDELPKNAEILKKVEEIDGVKREDVVHVLQRKPARKKSGVSVIAVMTSPEGCPHGRCKMCPGGPDSQEPSPQSYTGEEPAALRGERNDFDPYEQVKDRLKQYRAIGHETDKIDMIIMGGTFPARDWEYQKRFVKGCFEALNDERADDLKEAKSINEDARKRCVGMTIETRPDYCKEKELNRMLKLGATKVEIGVQSLRDEILEDIQRGHSVQDSIEATRKAKKKGFKVCHHIMPGLPGMTMQDDLEDFKKLFSDPRFRPDMLKIYPALVVEGTEIYRDWEDGKYEPLSTEKAAELIAEMKAEVPSYVRIQRVQRDIPSPIVEGGVKKSNLRQYARKELKDQGKECDCIRCREAGHSDKDIDMDSIGLKKKSYEASEGKEHFLEISDPENILLGYARIRTEDEKSPMVRELKVVGEMTPVDKKGGNYQHSGFGSKLLSECEDIAKKHEGELRVISGVGARNYYRKKGYKLKEPYMIKKL